MSETLNNILNLISEVKKDNSEIADSLKELIVDAIKAPANYYNAVISMVAEIKVAREYGDENLTYITEKSDRNRRAAHIKLTQAINQLNRWAKMYGLEPVFNTGRESELDPDNSSDRQLAAVLGYRFSNELFLDEMVRSNIFFDAKTYEDIDSILYEMEEYAVKFNTHVVRIEEIKEKAEKMLNKEKDIDDNRGVNVDKTSEGISR